VNDIETFYFIGKCLTIYLEEKDRQDVEKHFKSKDVESDNIVSRKDKAELALKSPENPRTNRA
jgi:hypothetical protein